MTNEEKIARIWALAGYAAELKDGPTLALCCRALDGKPASVTKALRVFRTLPVAWKRGMK